MTVAEKFQITPHSSIEQVKERIDEYLKKEKKVKPRFEFKNIGEDLQKRYRTMCKDINLPFYVKIVHDVTGSYYVIMSRFPLFAGPEGEVEVGRKRGQYVEIRNRKGRVQRTFVWASKNNKNAGKLGTIHITDDKFYTDVPWKLEFLGLRMRRLKIVQVHFVVQSDAIVDITRDRINASMSLSHPNGRDIDMITKLLDARVCEKVMAVNSLLISENSRIMNETGMKEDTLDTRMYKKLETALEDMQTTGQVVTKSKWGNISILPGSVKELAKWIIIIAGIYLIIGLVLSYYGGMPIPGIGSPIPPVETPPGTGEPVTGMPFIMFSWLRVLFGGG